MAFSRYFLNLRVLIYTGSAAALAANFNKSNVALSAASSSENSTDLSAAPAALVASSGWTLLGCYTDSVSARSLPYGAGVPGGPSAMTNELCQSTCHAAGYTLAGTEYSDECCKYLFFCLYMATTLTLLQIVVMLSKMEVLQLQMAILCAI
jgi:hypothetical protein